MFADDYDAAMLGPLRAAGLVLTHKFGKMDDGLELSFEDPGRSRDRIRRGDQSRGKKWK
jgi:hypothetical protein